MESTQRTSLWSAEFFFLSLLLRRHAWSQRPQAQADRASIFWSAVQLADRFETSLPVAVVEVCSVLGNLQAESIVEDGGNRLLFVQKITSSSGGLTEVLENTRYPS